MMVQQWAVAAAVAVLLLLLVARKARAGVTRADAEHQAVDGQLHLVVKGRGRLDPAVWGALSDLEKVRWPSEPQHAPLEKKLLRAERLLTGCLLPGSAPVLEKTVATLRICSKKFLLR